MKTPENIEQPKKLVRSVGEVIRQRRAQILIHSCIYYELNESIISDHQWQAYAFELALLQAQNPDQCALGFFDKAFEDWTGGHGGSHLPIRVPWVMQKAHALLRNPNIIKLRA